MFVSICAGAGLENGSEKKVQNLGFLIFLDLLVKCYTDHIKVHILGFLKTSKGQNFCFYRFV